MKKLSIALGIILVLVLAGSGTGFYLGYGELTTVRSELQAARNVIVLQQDQTEKNTQQIGSLQSQLQEKARELDSTAQELDSTSVKLTNTAAQLANTANTLTATRSLLEAANSEKEALVLERNNYKDGFNNTKLQLEAAQAKIQLMKDTFGDVAAGVLPVGAITDGTLKNVPRAFRLVRNPAAVNPSWDRLIAFLKADTTDNIRYVDGLYTCGNFAEAVFNNAEAIGIRTAIVCITFRDQDVGHALNAFVTSDKGLVYIDCTGASTVTHPIMDSQVTVKLGQAYQREFINPCNYYFESMGLVSSISIYW